MVSKVQMYIRTAKGKGFIQKAHLIAKRDFEHIKGICAGLSKEWLIYYNISNSDAGFWKQYGGLFANLGAAVHRQDSQSSCIHLTGLGPPVDHNSPTIWQPFVGGGAAAAGPSLKFYGTSFRKGGAHAFAAYTPGGVNAGCVFDPNIGQRDIGGSNHYQDIRELWRDLESIYEFHSIDVYHASFVGMD
jgi:hypothetical protein